jgi:hypothetical protein
VYPEVLRDGLGERGRQRGYREQVEQVPPDTADGDETGDNNKSLNTNESEYESDNSELSDGERGRQRGYRERVEQVPPDTADGDETGDTDKSLNTNESECESDNSELSDGEWRRKQDQDVYDNRRGPGRF